MSRKTRFLIISAVTAVLLVALFYWQPWKASSEMSDSAMFGGAEIEATEQGSEAQNESIYKVTGPDGQDPDIEIEWENGSEAKAKAGSKEVPDDWVSLDGQKKATKGQAVKKAANGQVSPAQKGAAATSKNASSAKKSSNKPAVKNSDESESEKFKDYKVEVDYAKLLKKPDLLGFVPDEELFKQVYYRIRTSFVENVSDEQLKNGVVTEVKALLKAAGVSAQALHSLNKNRNIFTQINDLYGDKVDRRILNFAAINGMMSALKDPFSVLMTPSDYSKLMEEVQTKNFGGIGVYIEMDKENGNQITVFEPIEGTPAYKAGVESGDKILAINGKSTKGMALDVATSLIRGPVDSVVKLKVKRSGRPEPFVINVTRGSIHVVSCTSKVIDGHIGYIRLRQFGQMTESEMRSELNKLRTKGITSLILDLRNNGGGYVDASVGVVGQFIPKDALVVYTLDRNKQRQNLLSREQGGLNIPIVVLINRYSASASEITAGALKDHQIAKLVGEKSFGKGSVQQLFPFSDKSAMKMTIARFYSPSGRVIDHKGISPDYKVAMEPRFVGKGKKDVQLNKAVELLENLR